MAAADLRPSCSYCVSAHSISFFLFVSFFFNFSSIITVNDFFDCMLSGQKCCASSLFFLPLLLLLFFCCFPRVKRSMHSTNFLAYLAAIATFSNYYLINSRILHGSCRTRKRKE